MQYQFVYKLLSFLLISLSLLSCGNEEPAEKTGDASAQLTNAEGVVAKVGDELITFDQLRIMLNSSPMVGLSIPALVRLSVTR